MRRVFSNMSEVCQKWAENSQEEGRAGDVSFSHDTIFSFGWYAMARICEDRKVVLFRDETYSHFKSRHQGEVLSAARTWGYRIFRVVDIGGDHDVNVAGYLANMKQSVMDFDKTQRHGRWILERNETLYRELLAYCQEFRLKNPLTLGLYLDKNYPFIARRFYTIPGGADLFLPKWLAKKGMDNVESRDILRTRNAEIRREIIRRLGIERICYDLKAEIIDRQGEYELVVLDLRDGRRRPFLKMHNPSVPEIWHLEGVHPAIKTVQDALNYRRYGDAMLVFPTPADFPGSNWRERRENRNRFFGNPENMKVKAEFVTSPLFPGQNDWNPEKLT